MEEFPTKLTRGCTTWLDIILLLWVDYAIAPELLLAKNFGITAKLPKANKLLLLILDSLKKNVDLPES
jgi:hypothetical protein